MPTRETVPRRSLRRPASLLAAVCAGLLGCRVPTPPPATANRDAAPSPALATAGKTLLAHYMPWYQTPARRGAWGSHWNGPDASHHPDQLGPDGLPDIWSHYHPLIGPYDSTDPDVLECHLLQMKLAGIDGVIADWYGIGATADYPLTHEATRALFAATVRCGMKFAACYEDRSVKLMVEWNHLRPEAVTNHLAATFQWMHEEWFGSPAYQRIHGRPLVLNFGPVYLQQPEVWQAAMAALPERPALFGLHHLWRRAGADGGFTWVHRDPWEGTPPPQQILNRIGEVFTYFSSNVNEVIVSAFPGFNDVYAHENHHEIDHRGGQTLRETLTVAMAGPWPLIQVVTWNDYGEGTMIEPTHEFGYSFLEIIQAARRAEQGEAFRFTAEDLRLPARLLALRQGGALPAAPLEAIADLLRQGRCADARAALDRLAAP